MEKYWRQPPERMEAADGSDLRVKAAGIFPAARNSAIVYVSVSYIEEWWRRRESNGPPPRRRRNRRALD
jgi:hypothetical protein